jgi:hypothetical protein
MQCIVWYFCWNSNLGKETTNKGARNSSSRTQKKQSFSFISTTYVRKLRCYAICVDKSRTVKIEFTYIHEKKVM